MVCERCGNVQIASGARRVTHRECLKNAEDHFSMIRFVK
jgi:beta-glucosidase